MHDVVHTYTLGLLFRARICMQRCDFVSMKVSVHFIIDVLFLVSGTKKKKKYIKTITTPPSPSVKQDSISVPGT